ncbi:Putative metal-dependent hydrolase YfiT [Paenibacillus allorhizoplanae]|uniref:Metal-dependent hydrolase YfiT n=1 Tax=Paenibacillus allorhizoplanae TaxID=2905648 RepID=A0ABM9C679_9BACL|nr:putative metal-dependent hydrolase [Paenibacillus allorhizoplanae]CAH1203743.1 Putative metal-dependent hydrolase YfiT [Paenibacillus allorhizoplanae]
MEQLRYPIGRFERIEQPTQANRDKWVSDIAETADLLRMTVLNLNQEQRLTPYRPGGWTVQQVVHHMADNDMNAFLRFKRALTEDSPVASSYREDLWAELSDYQVPIEVSIQLLESIHIRFVAVLRSLDPADYKKTFTSPVLGVLSLETALQRFVWHDRHHIAQIASLKERMGW